MKPILQDLVDCAIDTLKTSKDGHLPTCIFMKDWKPQNMCQYLYESDSDKRGAYIELAKAAIVHRSDAVIMINEVWISKLKTNEKIVRPSESSSRIEALHIAVISKGKDHDITITIPFTRNNLGIETKELEIFEDTHLGGNMGDIFHDAFDTMDMMYRVRDMMKLASNPYVDTEIKLSSEPEFDTNKFVKQMQERVKKEGGKE